MELRTLTAVRGSTTSGVWNEQYLKLGERSSNYFWTMNTLFLSRRNPYPPTSGGETRTWAECQKYAEYGDVLVATPYESLDTPDPSIHHVPIRTRVFVRPGSLFRAWNGAHVLGNQNVYHRLVSQRIVSQIDRRNCSFDLVVSDCPQMNSAATRLAEQHGVDHIVSKQTAEFTLLGEFLADVPLPDPVCKRAINSLRQLEQTAIDDADAVVFQSEEDQREFEIPANKPVVYVPNGTDYQAMRKTDNPEGLRTELGIPPERFVCLYVGSYDFFANREAAKFIAEKLAPACPDVAFVLVGRDPPSTTQTNVYAPGYVENLADALALADVALCPLTRGAGTKLKMMDYLAAGLPIVTTEVGASSIDIEDGSSGLVCSLSEFPDMIERLRTDQQLRTRLSTNAASLGRQYDWSALLSKYDDIIDRLGLTAVADGQPAETEQITAQNIDDSPR